MHRDVGNTRIDLCCYRTATTTYWLCTERRPGRRCTASILQQGDDYRRGNNEHCHRPQADQLGKTRVQHAVRSMAKGELFRSAHSIFEEAVQRNFNAAQPVDAMPTVQNLVIHLSKLFITKIKDLDYDI